MGYTNESLNEGLDRLQRLLLAMRTGDDLRCQEAARLSGLSETTCRTVLESLTRAGLMSEESDGRFVRRSLDAVTS
jgi:DNA-binding IclR family transcriptional regulator